MAKRTHPLTRSRKHLHDLVRIKRVNRQLLSSGMSWKEIRKFWNGAQQVARDLPKRNPCALKYGDRIWLRDTRKILEEAGIENGLIPCRNVD